MATRSESISQNMYKLNQTSRVLVQLRHGR